MTRNSAMLCLLLTAGFTSAALAQTAPAATVAPAGPAKVAIVAFQPALAQTNEGQRAMQALQTKYQPEQEHLKALSDEIDSLKKQLQVDADKLSPEERASRTQTIDTKDKALQLAADDARTRFQTEMQDTFAKIADKVGRVMVTYAQNNGFTVVLDISNQEQSPVLWWAPSTDITQAVITAYNASTPTITAPTAPRPAGSAARPSTAPRSTAKPATSH